MIGAADRRAGVSPLSRSGWWDGGTRGGGDGGEGGRAALTSPLEAVR